MSAATHSDGNRESGRKLSSDYDDDVRVRSSVHHSSANLYAILLSLDSISATSGKKPDKLRMRLQRPSEHECKSQSAAEDDGRGSKMEIEKLAAWNTKMTSDDDDSLWPTPISR